LKADSRVSQAELPFPIEERHLDQQETEAPTASAKDSHSEDKKVLSIPAFFMFDGRIL